MEQSSLIGKQRLTSERTYILHVLELRFPGQVTAGLTQTVHSQAALKTLSRWFDDAVTSWSMVDFLIDSGIGWAEYHSSQRGR